MCAQRTQFFLFWCKTLFFFLYFPLILIQFLLEKTWFPGKPLFKNTWLLEITWIWVVLFSFSLFHFFTLISHFTDSFLFPYKIVLKILSGNSSSRGSGGRPWASYANAFPILSKIKSWKRPGTEVSQSALSTSLSCSVFPWNMQIT